MEEIAPAVYMLASRRNGTLYCGSTIHLARRIFEHKEGVNSRFPAKYGVTRLVWYELHGEIGAAVQREYRIKQWKRAWKLRLIEEMNPTWRDLYEDLI
ncbi:MAG: GIY-YIG nuclease family protein [Oceanicaulis sp.]